MQNTVSIAQQSDVELLLRVRTGDQGAEQALLAHHRAALEDLPPSSSYDSVEASGRAAVALVREGRDHDLPFRATWLAVHTQGDIPAVPARDLVVWSAFGTLPRAWRLAVWHREVEGQRVREIGRLLGMSEEQATRALASSYAALKRRAAISHTTAGAGPECEDLVGTYRFSPPANLSTAEIRSLREHGRHCDDCLDLIRNLLVIEHTLRDTLAGVVLGEAAESYLARRPRVARLRVTSSAPGFERRRVHPVLASLSATAVGAAAMALVLSSPALSPSPAGPATAQASVPIPGASLQQSAGYGTPRPPASVSLTPSRADGSSTAAPDAGQSGGKGDGGRDGSGSDAAEPPAPAPAPGTPGAPVTPPEPGPPIDPSPGPDPSTPPEDTATLAVVVTSEQVEVTLDPVVGPDEPVVVDVPVPEVPDVPVTLPISSGTLGRALL